MSIVRYPGFNIHGFQRDLQREMNRLFDGFFPTSRKSSEDGFESAVWRPVVDVHEDDHTYLIDVELPGLTRDDINLNFQDGTLSIAGERSYGYEKKGDAGNGTVQGKEKSAHRLERFYGKFHRSFIGFQLNDVFVERDCIAFLFQPAADLDFADGLAHFGDFQFDAHSGALNARAINSSCSR